VSVAIEFRCGTCGKLLRTGEENAGRPAACPACGDGVEVPLSEGEAGAVLIRDEPPDAVPPRAMVREHRGGIILAFGILSWVSTCFLFGVAAWAMGVEDLRAMRAGEMDSRGERVTRAGMILGAISVVLTLVILLGLVATAGLAIVFS
jgi:DNA-directed RNA polymerase subunit RPC12/RpoP